MAKYDRCVITGQIGDYQEEHINIELSILFEEDDNVQFVIRDFVDTFNQELLRVAESGIVTEIDKAN